MMQQTTITRPKRTIEPPKNSEKTEEKSTKTRKKKGTSRPRLLKRKPERYETDSDIDEITFEDSTSTFVGAPQFVHVFKSSTTDTKDTDQNRRRLLISGMKSLSAYFNRNCDPDITYLVVLSVGKPPMDSVDIKGALSAIIFELSKQGAMIVIVLFLLNEDCNGLSPSSLVSNMLVAGNYAATVTYRYHLDPIKISMTSFLFIHIYIYIYIYI